MRSASDIAHATHVAPLPSSCGCRAAARPPADPAGTGRPSWSKAKDIGPRFEAMTRSAFTGDRPRPYATDPTPRLRRRLRRATMGRCPTPRRPPTHRPRPSSPPTPSREPHSPRWWPTPWPAGPGGRVGARRVPPRMGARASPRSWPPPRPGRTARARGRGTRPRSPGRWAGRCSPGGGWRERWRWWSRPRRRACPWPGGPRATIRGAPPRGGRGSCCRGRGRRRPARAPGGGGLGHHRRRSGCARGDRSGRRSGPDRRGGGL